MPIRSYPARADATTQILTFPQQGIDYLHRIAPSLINCYISVPTYAGRAIRCRRPRGHYGGDPCRRIIPGAVTPDEVARAATDATLAHHPAFDSPDLAAD